MTLVKICGLTNFEDARVAIEAGADFLGFIFYEKSPRAAAPDAVSMIIQAFDAGKISDPVGVGVFVNPTGAEVKTRLAECGLKAAQVHKLNRDGLRDVQKQIYGAAFAAIQPKTLDEAFVSLDMVKQDGVGDMYRTPAWCPQLLVDAYHPGLHGGTGQRADMNIAQELKAHVPRLVLAGGLTPDNVADAIRAARPWAVDVASGVEQSPGKKDHGKVRAFIQAVRDVDKDIN